ncbi:hypothetical protein ACE6H2_020466 [Prunus campanulata]
MIYKKYWNSFALRFAYQFLVCTQYYIIGTADMLTLFRAGIQSRDTVFLPI